MSSFAGLHIHFLSAADGAKIPEHNSHDVKEWIDQVRVQFPDATSDLSKNIALDKLTERRPVDTKWVLLWPVHYFMPLCLRAFIEDVLVHNEDKNDIYSVQTRAAPDFAGLDCEQMISDEHKLPALKSFTRGVTLSGEVTGDMLVTRQHLLVRPEILEQLQLTAFTVSTFRVMPKTGVSADKIRVKLLSAHHAVPRRTYIGATIFPRGGYLQFIEAWDRQCYPEVIRYGQVVLAPGSDMRKRLASEIKEHEADWFTSQEDFDDVVLHLFSRALVLPVEGKGPLQSESPIVRLLQNNKARKEHAAWLIKNVYGPEAPMSRALASLYCSQHMENKNTQYVSPMADLWSLLPTVSAVSTAAPEKPKCSLSQKIRIAISLALTIGVNLYRVATVCPAAPVAKGGILKDEL